jgi:hypothetical protein
VQKLAVEPEISRLGIPIGVRWDMGLVHLMAVIVIVCNGWRAEDRHVLASVVPVEMRVFVLDEHLLVSIVILVMNDCVVDSVISNNNIIATKQIFLV